MTVLTAEDMKRLGVAPKAALLSHSCFGSSGHPSAVKMRQALERVRRLAPWLESEGEMHGDAALNGACRREQMPRSTLQGDATLLVLPNIDAANIAYNLLKLALREHFHVPPDSERFRVIHDGAVRALLRHPARRADDRWLGQQRPTGAPVLAALLRRLPRDASAGRDGRESALRAPPVSTAPRSGAAQLRGAVLVVDDCELSNIVVFACKGTAIDAAHAGVVRRPQGLNRSACECCWARLQASIARCATATTRLDPASWSTHAARVTCDAHPHSIRMTRNHGAEDCAVDAAHRSEQEGGL
jgi:hypothetical protein